MGSVVGHPTRLENDNEIAVSNGAQSMGDNYAAATTSSNCIHDAFLHGWIKRTGGLIANHNLRLYDQ